MLKISAVLFATSLICLQISSAKEQKPQIRIQVQVVSLDLEVVDRQGIPVDGLTQKDFVVKENGVPVEISSFSSGSDAPVSLVIALGTAFMPQPSLSTAKDTISQLIHMLKPDDEICLYTFDQRDAYLEQSFTCDRPRLVHALENIAVLSRAKRPGGFSRSFQIPPQAGRGIDLGLAAAKKGAHQKKALLLIRDHIENLGIASLDHLRQSGCTLFALGFTEEKKNRLKLFSDKSGAEQLILGPTEVQASDDSGSVTELCRTIVRLLSSRYNLTFHTPLAEKGGPRRIEVLLPRHDYRIMARRTYIPSH